MKALIVAGEASGDLYGGELAEILKTRISELSLYGMGGSRMKEAGIRLLYDCRDVSVLGFFEVPAKLSRLRSAFKRIQAAVEKDRPDFAVLIDYPGFNFRLADCLKKIGIRIFYFISPQVWAWRKKRMFFLKDHVDLMICILPFEKSLYEEIGAKVIYVGHPLVEIVRKEVATQSPYPKTDHPLIGIMPGSREIEVSRHLPVLTETIQRIKSKREIDAILMWPPSLEISRFEIGKDIKPIMNERYAAMKACDLLLVASGTSTLEAAILGTPLFIVYRVGGLSWQLGKALVRVPYYGLVNWIAQEKVIPEYMQKQMDPDRLAADCLAFLSDPSKAQVMKKDLARVVESLGPSGALERAADAILAAL